MLAAAREYGEHHWGVFPLRGKLPAIPSPHPKGSPERTSCKGECGQHGHGVLDATDDIATITAWWSGEYRGCNIGVRIPDSMFVIDIDPRSGGDKTLAELERQYGPLPQTLSQLSGRGDGGCHYFFRRPPGKLSAKRLGPGIDIKTSTGYVVGAPSIHPDSGKPYVRVDHPMVAAPPAWLVELLLPQRPDQFDPPDRPRAFGAFTGPSIADAFCANTSWSRVLGPHGWRCTSADPDGDGAIWLHPRATSMCSATIRSGCLFVYSTNTPFNVTESSNPNGYTKFRAYAVLEHGGDMSAAARALRGTA